LDDVGGGGDLRLRRIALLENVNVREPWVFLPHEIGKNTFCPQVKLIRKTEIESTGTREVILSTSRLLPMTLDTAKEATSDGLEPIWIQRLFFLRDN
jgi:hypothetical protein